MATNKRTQDAASRVKTRRKDRSAPALDSPPDFGPVFTKGQVRKLESTYDEVDTRRRLMQMALTRSSGQLVEAAGAPDGIRTTTELAEVIAAYRDHLEATIELANCAIARLAAVGLYVSKNPH